jgi:hypothetical protein
MTRIVVDAELRKKLQDFMQTVELCDEEGHVLARVVPHLDPDLYENLEPQISEEELQRRENSTEWYTTAEVLARLEKLP